MSTPWSHGGTTPKSSSPPDALTGAVQFLIAHQGLDGLWHDFDTPAGEASLWPTAFVARALVATNVGHEALGRANAALIAAQQPDGGWGYNQTVPSDADSTAWALLALSSTSGHDGSCERAASRLVEHQRPRSGGIATYATPGPIRRFMKVGWWMPFGGWCAPHLEISATVGCALLAYRSRTNDLNDAIDSAWRYVTARQHPTGAWSSYWWTSPHYATARATEFAAARGERQHVKQAADWVLTQLNSTTSVFAAALSLTVLKAAHADRDAIEQLTRQLMHAQQRDGGWLSDAVMRIPVPPDKDPNREHRWRVIRFSEGIEVRDQHRCFTTAACIAALAGDQP